MASDRPRKPLDEGSKERLMELVLCLLETAETLEGGRTRLLENLACMDPFCQYLDITESILKELTDGH
jgi:hypothetical protein